MYFSYSSIDLHDFSFIFNILFAYAFTTVGNLFSITFKLLAIANTNSHKTFLVFDKKWILGLTQHQKLAHEGRLCKSY